MNDDALMGGRLTLNGDVDLILMNGNTFEVTNGIDVGTHKLTIWGQFGDAGNLIISNPTTDLAGIGGTGSVEINGGNIDATGGAYAPGIGGNYNKHNTLDGLTITINGGTVVSTSGGQSAVLGGAYDENTGLITINGGSVVANGSSFGAGIGAAGSRGTMEGIVISGGNITANGGLYGAGIGGGDGTKNVSVTINGGTINATGGERAAGIGGGAEGKGSLVITGGNITAHAASEDGSGIGGGKNGKMNVRLSYADENPDPDMRIEADYYGMCTVALDKAFQTEDGSVTFAAGPVSDLDALAQQPIKPAGESYEAPSETGSVFGGGALGIAVAVACLLAFLAAGYALGKSSGKSR